MRSPRHQLARLVSAFLLLVALLGLVTPIGAAAQDASSPSGPTGESTFWTDRGDGCWVLVVDGEESVVSCYDEATGCTTETTVATGESTWSCNDPVTGCYTDSAGNTTCGDPTTGAVGWYQQADGCTAYWDGTQDAVVQCTDAVTGCYLEVYPDGFSWWQCTDPATGCVTDSWGGDSCQTGSLPEGWYEDGVGCFVYWDGSVYSETSCVVPVPEPCTVDPVSGISSCQRGGGECFLSEDGMLACPTYMAPDVVPGPETAFSVGGGDVSQPAVTGSTTADESGAETPAMDSAPESEEDGPFDNGVRTFDGDDWYVTPRI